MTAEKMSFAAFSRRYCETQDQSPSGLLAVLRTQQTRYNLVGWFLAECQMLDSSYRGSVVAVPYGPDNTFKEPPAQTFSPRGLASDMSVAIGYCLAEGLPDSAEHIEAEQWWLDTLHETAKRAVDEARKAKRRKSG